MCLTPSQERAAHAAREADRERQVMAERHLAHITALQGRIDDERRALEQEAAARSEALATAREGAAAAAGAAQMAALETRYAAQLAASQSCADAMRAEVSELQAAFQAYQAQKAGEVAELEERLVMLIGGAAPSKPLEAAGSLPAQHRNGAHGMHVGAGRAQQAGPHVRTAARAVGRGVARNCKGHHGASAAAAGRKAGGPKGTHHGSIWAQEEDEQAQLYQVPPAAGAAPVTSGVAAMAVADAAADDAAAAARREALFERLGRQRAEAQLVSARKALQGAKTRLRLVARQLEALRQGSISTDEHARVLNELAACRDALKTARQESARRQRALQLLQGLSGAGLIRAPGGPAAQPGPPAPEPLLAQAATAAATAATAAAQAASCAASPEHMPWPLPADDGEVGAGLEYFPRGPGAAAQGVAGAGDDPFAVAATTAAAAAAAAVAALEQERAAREALEAKLKDLKASAERKGTLVK